MRKLIVLFFIVSILCLLSGCGGGNDSPGSPSSTYSITVNTYDQGNKQSLTGVSLSILETGQNIPMSNSSQTIPNLNSGQYTIYLSEKGYITKGYVINLSTATVINAYLKPVNPVEYFGTVSGKVLDNGNDYAGTFDVCTANQTYNFDTPNTPSPFSDIKAVCGNITVSTYTSTGNGIDKIVYLKTSLATDESQTGLSLTLPTSPTNYSGTKPAGDTLVVKQSDGCVLASQTTTSTLFSFGVTLLSEDSLTLESSQTNNNTTCFTRVAAGSSGGQNINLQYQNSYPTINKMTPNGSDYEIDFNPVSFASYYEVYGIQITGSNDIQILFETIGLSGTSVKVPQSNFVPGADTTFLIYVRAINLPGFNITNILNGSQSYSNYTYTESDQTLGLISSSLSTLNLNQNLKATIAKAKTKYHLNYLFTE